MLTKKVHVNNRTQQIKNIPNRFRVFSSCFITLLIIFVFELSKTQPNPTNKQTPIRTNFLIYTSYRNYNNNNNNYYYYYYYYY